MGPHLPQHTYCACAFCHRAHVYWVGVAAPRPANMKLRTVLLVFGLVALGVADHEQRSDNCCVKVDTTTRQLVDIYGERDMAPAYFTFWARTCVGVFSAGRARIFHGINVVGPVAYR